MPASSKGDSASPSAPAEPGASPALGRARRALAGAAEALGLAALFITSAAGSIVLHLDSAPARRIAQDVTNSQLGSLFQGKIIAGEIDHVGLDEIEIRSAITVDPRGAQVIRASSIRARADLVALAQSALFGDGDLLITIPDIRVEQADVLVEQGPNGVPTIADAFAPVEAAPSQPSASPSAPSRIVRVSLPHIEIGHATIHGAVAPPRVLDADVSRLVGSVLVHPDGVAVDVERTGIVDRAFLPARTSGTVTYHLRAGETARMWSTFAGQIGGLTVLCRAEIDDDVLTATAEVPAAAPAELHTLLPGLPLRETIAARVDIAGVIPTFDISARFAVRELGAETNAVAVEGRLQATSPLRAELDVDAKDVDPALFSADLPSGALRAKGRVSIVLEDALPSILVDARTEPAFLSGQVVPAADVHLAFERGELSGITQIDEIGAPTRASFVVIGGDGVRFEAASDIASIARFPRGPRAIDGSVRVQVKGSLRGQSLEADVTGSVAGLRAPGDVRVGRGNVRGRVSGLLDELRVEAAVKGENLRAGGYDFSRFNATAVGPVMSPHLQADFADEQGASVTAKGELDTLSGGLRAIEATLRRDGNEVSGKIARLSPDHGVIRLDGIDLRGGEVGNVAGSLRIEGDEVFGSLHGEAVDLERVAKLAEIPYRVKGVANIDIELERAKGGRKGHVRIELEDGQVAFLHGISAQVTAAFDGDAATTDGLVRLVAEGAPDEPDETRCDGTIASVVIQGGRGKLDGPLLRARTWANAVGSVSVAADDWNLACLRKIVPVGLPISDIRGTATTRFVLERAAGQRFPSVRDGLFRTRNLHIDGPEDLHEDHPAWSSHAIDARLTGSLDGTTGGTQADLVIFDGERLAELDLGADLDLATLFDRPSARGASLASSPLSGQVTIPERPMAGFLTLPTFVRDVLPPLAGQVGVDGYVDGTVGKPFVALRVRGRGVAHALAIDATEPSPWALPVDVDALATYDSARATLDAHVTKDGREIASAGGQVDVALDDALGGPSDRKVPWRGELHGKLSGVPLEQIPLLAESEVKGKAVGTFSISDLHQRPELAIDLAFPGLRVGDGLEFARSSATLHITHGHDADGPNTADTAVARVEFTSRQGSRLDATAYAGVRWRGGVVPEIDDASPADLYTVAEHFRLAAFQPFLASYLSRFDGDLQGHLRLGWNRLREGEKANVSADMQITGGIVHVPQIGQELRDVTAHITSTPGSGAVRFDDISARGISGGLHGWALARLDGLRLREAAGELVINEGDELPITLEGVPLGNAHGTVTFTAEKHDNEIAARVSTKAFYLELPASSGRNVQSLDEHPDVHVSHPLGPPKEPRSADALRYALTLEVARAEITGTDLQLVITGSPGDPPKVELSDAVRLTGTIALASGKITVFGKPFELDQGVVRLRPEDPSNPHLNVTAHWDSPNGYRVFVDYGGILWPLTNDKIRLRSSPPLAANEILALVLFGSVPEATSTEAGGASTAGAEGFVSEALFSKLLGGLTPLKGLSTRIGTAQTADGGRTIRTSLAYDIGDSLTASASFEGGASVGGTTETAQAQDTAQSTQRTEVGVDWRFTRNWLIRGTFGVGPSSPGQTGSQTRSGLDLLWQYRY